MQYSTAFMICLKQHYKYRKWRTHFHFSNQYLERKRKFGDLFTAQTFFSSTLASCLPFLLCCVLLGIKPGVACAGCYSVTASHKHAYSNYMKIKHIFYSKFIVILYDRQTFS